MDLQMNGEATISSWTKETAIILSENPNDSIYFSIALRKAHSIEVISLAYCSWFLLSSRSVSSHLPKMRQYFLESWTFASLNWPTCIKHRVTCGSFPLWICRVRLIGLHYLLLCVSVLLKCCLFQNGSQIEWYSLEIIEGTHKHYIVSSN